MRRLRIVAVAAIVGIVSLALFPAFLALRSQGTKVFEPESFDYVLVGVSTFAIALGAQVIPWRTRRSITLFATLASGCLLFGILAVFSIGLALLPAGVVMLVLLYRRLRLAPRDMTATRAALGGVAVGFAVPLLFIGLIIPATVECGPNGNGGTSSRRWYPGTEHVTMGSNSADGRVVTGRIDDGDSYVTYRCEEGRVAMFERRAK